MILANGKLMLETVVDVDCAGSGWNLANAVPNR